jgi:hypothetical protein
MPTVSPTIASANLIGALRRLPDYPEDYHEFRAKLYAAAPYLKKADQLRQLRKFDFPQPLPPDFGDGLERLANEIRSDIGDAWCDAIVESKSFTGIRDIRLLSEYCGLEYYYLGAWRQHSLRAHGDGAWDRVFVGGVKLESVLTVLEAAAGLEGQALEYLDLAFDLNAGEKIRKVVETLQLAIQNSPVW